jgi:hypothetical protein
MARPIRATLVGEAAERTLGPGALPLVGVEGRIALAGYGGSAPIGLRAKPALRRCKYIKVSISVQ